MSKEITSVREALIHEALKDMDDIIKRISEVDEGIARRIEEATKEAVGRAHHSALLNFKSMILEQEKKLLEAGRNGASMIGAQLNTGITQLIAVNEALEKKALRFLFLWTVLALIGGLIGGVVAVKMLAA